MRGIVDRFEGGFAVIEINGNTTDVQRTEVAAAVRPGDVVVYTDGRWVTDQAATQERAAEMKKRMDQVWEKE